MEFSLGLGFERKVFQIPVSGLETEIETWTEDSEILSSEEEMRNKELR